MAPLNIMRNFAPAMAVGVLSAAANVVEKQAKENPDPDKPANGNGNAFFQNASLWGDIVIGGYSVFNYSQNQGSRLYPQSENESLAMAGAGMALLTRRASDWIGATFLKLPTGSRYTPSRSMQRGRPSLRPASAIETGILPRKRQFFSVT
jgi:hypothetical protein